MNLFTSDLFTPAQQSAPDRRAAFGAAPAYGRRYGWRRGHATRRRAGPRAAGRHLGRFATAPAHRGYDRAA